MSTSPEVIKDFEVLDIPLTQPSVQMAQAFGLMPYVSAHFINGEKLANVP